MTAPLTEKAYELMRAPLFDGPSGQGATAAKQGIADAIAEKPWDLFDWLTSAGVVDHVVFHTDKATVTISRKGAKPVCTHPDHDPIFEDDPDLG